MPSSIPKVIISPKSETQVVRSTPSATSMPAGPSLGSKGLPCNTGYIMPGAEWVDAFSRPQRAIPALNQAAFLANQAILQAAAGSSSLFIQSRSHLEYLRPEISTGTVIGLSVLIGVFSFCWFSCVS
jgi:hypothetical protein